MKDLEIKLPDNLKSEKPRIEKRIGELIVFQEKRKKTFEFCRRDYERCRTS